MNCPRYVNPAGTCDCPPPETAIAPPIFLRLGSPSCLLTPFGPSLVKRNGGTAAAGPAPARLAEAVLGGSSASRPPTLSERRPSPMT